jgi:hypothetical protein
MSYLCLPLNLQIGNLNTREFVGTQNDRSAVFVVEMLT